jgi:hypothetical protein
MIGKEKGGDKVVQGNNSVRLPKVLINSVPKSGTNLLVQIIKGIPGMEKDQDDFYRKDNYMQSLSIRRGQFGVGHIPYDVQYARLLNGQGIKQVFIYRDLRDIVVSWTHFLLSTMDKHPVYPVFTKHYKNHNQRLLAAIKGFDFVGTPYVNRYGVSQYPNLYDRYKQIFAWLKNSNILHIRYEELVRNARTRRRTILRIVNFLWDDLQTLELSKRKLVRMMEKNIDASNSKTFRKGKIGGWRTEFSNQHKLEFKKVAGQFLIELGYENNEQW